MDKPHAPSCDRNRDPILAVLRTHFAHRHRVLEIGSGTGQHAVHFAAAMPWLSWQCSDRAENLPGIRLWLEEAHLANTPSPQELDVAMRPWPRISAAPADVGSDPSRFDAAFSANTLHILGWSEVEAFFAGLATMLAADATVVVYGPFNYGGAYSSDSNREFDGWLKARDARSGIRDFESVDALARTIGLRLIEDVAMPANNRCLVWRRVLE
ncbi:DUF938 domain-containing protein [Montanilutibacter psychrotolerans]|uniref:DUF938 domain-containing protein n=1 Tax=Montanilutibacter psychrotolerans TaxID=1327343 RepID=A0A3M8SWR5_9GAMM|nr:DUF938 domain-containing protein [Lysobacter psychrotolerans]RNF83654.1 DUF938 domain-containing protein [Lysobacter psychrotolerans]